MSEVKQTPEQKVEERAKVLASCKATSKIAKRLVTAHEQWIKEAESAFPAPYCFGDKRRQNKENSFSALYNRVYYGRDLYRRNVERFADEDHKAEEAAKQAEYDAEKNERTEKILAEAKRLRTAAVVWLLARGKELGKDFDVDNALVVANEIAYTEECQRRSTGDLNSFYGEDNCESCGGWDGVSHRCQCGNRRVSWTQGDDHTFESPSIYAEAY